MKHILHITFAFFLASSSLMAQQIGNLKGINYQAVAIDEDGKEIVGTDINGKPLYNKTIGIRFTITKTLNGAIQYQETHTTLTDAYGLFSVVIGQGEVTSEGAYTTLMDMPWIDADQFLSVEISTKNDNNYKLVSNQQFMSVPYSFYTDDIADDAINTNKIIDEGILNEDMATSSVDSRTILDESIAAQDIATGGVDSRTILDEAINTEDIATGAIDSRTILNSAVANEDIADATIDLTTKVTGILPVENGGTGNDGTTTTDGQLLIGNTSTGGFTMANLTPGTGIVITNSPGGIQISSGVQGINSSLAGNVQIGDPGTGACAGDGRELQAGATWVSPSIPLSGVLLGNIVVGSVNDSLKGCMMSTYVRTDNQIEVAIFNGTGAKVCFISNAELRVLVVQ